MLATEIAKRIGLVIAATIGCILLYGVLSAAWMVVPRLFSGGGITDDAASRTGWLAGSFGFAFGGGVGALVGGAVASSLEGTTRTMKIATWIVAAAIAIFCFWRLILL